MGFDRCFQTQRKAAASWSGPALSLFQQQEQSKDVHTTPAPQHTHTSKGNNILLLLEYLYLGFFSYWIIVVNVGTFWVVLIGLCTCWKMYIQFFFILTFLKPTGPTTFGPKCIWIETKVILSSDIPLSENVVSWCCHRCMVCVLNYGDLMAPLIIPPSMVLLHAHWTRY